MVDKHYRDRQQGMLNIVVCAFAGYMVERKKTKSERWIRLNVEPLPFKEYEARRMIEGTEYQIRVRAANEVGISDPSPPSIPFTPLGKNETKNTVRRTERINQSILKFNRQTLKSSSRPSC